MNIQGLMMITCADSDGARGPINNVEVATRQLASCFLLRRRRNEEAKKSLFGDEAVGKDIGPE